MMPKAQGTHTWWSKPRCDRFAPDTAGSFQRDTGLGLVIGLVWGLTACGPTTIDYQGHRIFNEYLPA